jgi:hypothetical protein
VGSGCISRSFAEDAISDGRALGDRFEGRAAIRSFLDDWLGACEELAFELEEVRDLEVDEARAAAERLAEPSRADRRDEVIASQDRASAVWAPVTGYG